MKLKQARTVYIVFLCFAILFAMATIPPGQPIHASPEREAAVDFYSSFEAGEPQPAWENTAETDGQGKKMASGIDGNIRSGIIGDVTYKVAEAAASGENPPSETVDKLLDSDPNTKWLTLARTGWVTYKLSEPEMIVKYILTSANDFAGRDPKNWSFSGSNNGTEWTVLDTRSDQSFSGRFQSKEYEFQNATKYSYYKLDITANSGEPLTQLADLILSTGIEIDSPPADMKAAVTKGPGNPYTAKANVGFTGLRAFTYSGTHIVEGRAYSYNKIFDVDIDVTADTELSYMILPEFTQNDLDYPSTYAAIDLAFSDGTYLHDYPATDQYGNRLTAQGQGEAKMLFNQQWNLIRSDIGAVAAGKTIKRILIAYDDPKAKDGKTFKGHIDDIKIDGNPVRNTYAKLSEYVDTRRGTQSNDIYSRGNNFPAVAVPHGFNFWTPKTNAGSDWIYQYHTSNNSENLPAIQAFALSHETSPWMGDRQTFHVMPSNSAGTPDVSRTARALPFRHSNEIAKPYYYGVTFENGMKTEFTPTDHAAMFRFTFTGNSSNLIFDNQSNNGGITLDAENGTISGYSDQRSGQSYGATRMFIYATFDQPVIASGKLTGSGGGGSNVQAYYKFDTTENKTVTMKMATSLISVEQARKNLELEIEAADTFESIQAKAQSLWDEKLGVITVEGASENQLITLYSSMYRLFLYPNSSFENTGTQEAAVYKHADFTPTTPCSTSTATQTCTRILDGKVYVNNGFWDTYRTVWPAYALLTPTHAGELIDGFVQQYRDGGWISRWSSPGYANLMPGTSSDIAFADAYLKGVTNFDVNSFYESALKNAAVAPPNDNVGRKGMAQSVFNGFTDISIQGTANEGLSWALDGYINDFGIAQLAKALSADDPERERTYNDEYQYYLNRALNYVNMFSPSVEFFRGKKLDGTWRQSDEEFNPFEWGRDYTETNAWGMAFHVPQDGQGLANLYGGTDKLASKLDDLFEAPGYFQLGAYGGEVHEMKAARDSRMGQYQHSNQPAHHIIYMYNYVGQPWKTQEKVREVLDRLYIGSEIGQGYPGDEDNGEMSAWYILSSLGLYPLKMGSPEYAIGAPLFKKATIHLDNGKQIVINAPNNSRENKYVQGLKLNGVDYTKNYIMHADLAGGATLDFDMGDRPSAWGSGEGDVPSSITQGTDIPRPLKDMTDQLTAQGLGKVSDSEGSAAAVLNNLFDNTSGTSATMNHAAPWIQFQFTKGKEEIKMYTLTSGAGSSANDPKSWVLKGSNDGETWVDLDARTNEKFEWRRYTRAFAIDDVQAFAYYRLDITENNGGTSTTLAELELLGNDVTDEEAVSLAIAAIDLGDTSAVTKSLALSAHGMKGTVNSWTSSDLAVMSHEGKIIKRPDFGEPDKAITLTVTVTRGQASLTKTFDIVVKAMTAADYHYEGGTDFATGLEPGDPLPDWKNARVMSGGITEICCGLGGMESDKNTDPPHHTGTTVLLYSGVASNPERSYSYNEVFNADIEVKPSTTLSYWFFPQKDIKGGVAANLTTSKYAMLDLRFTDGTYLHELADAVDQYGIRMHSKFQGASGNVQVDQWNQVITHVGAVAAGKTIDRIMIGFDVEGVTGAFRGSFDDIEIRHQSSEEESAAAGLSGITLDGVALAGFDTRKFVYEVELPAKSTTVPVVEAAAVNAKAKVEIAQADGVAGTAVITVTAEDGAMKLTYAVSFKVKPDEVADAAAVLAGPAHVGVGQEFEVAYGLKEAGKDLLAQDVVITYDADKLEFVSVRSLRADISVVGQSESNGQVRLLVAGLGEGADLNGDQLAVRFKVKSSDQDTVANMAAAVTAANGAGDETELLGAVYSVQINRWMPGDLNGDDKISIGDLAIVASAYGKRSTDSDWDRYKRADLNGDGIVDIEDLTALARRILNL